ncbi:MAG: triose-phosphate isomerase, partial [Pedobacter sp.]
MRKNIVAGNWKMNMGLKEGVQLFSELRQLINEEVKGDQEAVVCPPFIHISSFSQSFASTSRLSLGAQNCHQADSGAFTGEISASMLASAGARYVIIGHSERRLYFS